MLRAAVNPDVAGKDCIKDRGLVPGSSATAGVDFAWSCSGVCPGIQGSMTGSKLEFLPESLNATYSPYKISLNVYPVGGSSVSPLRALVGPVYVYVTEPVPDCPNPMVSAVGSTNLIVNEFVAFCTSAQERSNPTLCLPPGDVVLQTQVEPSPGIFVRWNLEEYDDQSDTWLVSSDVEALREIAVWRSGVTLGAGFGRNLQLRRDRLQGGASYRIRQTVTRPCGQVSASSFVTFVVTVNAAPTGGILEISPKRGVAGNTSFTLTASGFQDEDGPLLYRFFVRQDFGPTAPVRALSVASTSNELRTWLPLPTQALRDSGGNLTLFVQCVDQRGARSSLFAVSASDVDVTPITGNVDAAASLTTARNTGASEEDVLRLALSIATSALDQESGVGSTEDRNTLRGDVLAAIQDSQQALANASTTTPETVALQTLTLLSVLADARDADPAFLALGGATIRELLVDALSSLRRTAEDLGGSGGDESSNAELGLADYIPEDLAPNTIASLEGILAGLSSSSAAEFRRQLRGRGLQSGGGEELCQSASPPPECSAVNDLRATIRRLVKLLLTGTLPGATPRSVVGIDLQIVVSKDTPGTAGYDGGTQGMTVPGRNDNETSLTVSLPPGLLNASAVGLDELELPPYVDIVLVRFRINVRELVEGGYVNGTEPGAVASNVTEIISLEFQYSSDYDQGLEPSELDEGNRVIVEIPLGDAAPSGRTDTNVSCGAWDDVLGGWSSAGCEVIEVREGDNVLVCACTHASDYAAWQAFVADVQAIFSPQDIGTVATLAIVLLGIVFPSILVMLVTIALWSMYKDQSDSDLIHRGTFLLLLKNRIRLRSQQRRFFHALRENAKEPSKVWKTKQQLLEEIESERQARLQAERERRSKVCCYPLVQWLKAIKNEHSFFGLFWRFDPYTSRLERALVFVAVVLGNLLAASL